MLGFSRLKCLSRDTAPNFDVEANGMSVPAAKEVLRMKKSWLSRASVEKPNAESQFARDCSAHETLSKRRPCNLWKSEEQ